MVAGSARPGAAAMPRGVSDSVKGTQVTGETGTTSDGGLRGKRGHFGFRFRPWWRELAEPSTWGEGDAQLAVCAPLLRQSENSPRGMS
jgi:hypothetical protein